MTSAAGLIGRPVRWRGVRLGAAVDVLLDVSAPRALGLEMLARNGKRSFLPFTVVELGDREIGLASPLALVDSAVGFYREHGLSLAAVAGRPVDGLGVLEDVVLDADGAVEALLVRDGAELRRLPGSALRPAT